MGYHVKEIKKGVLGELSKIQEELDELCDAAEQANRVLVLCELADLYGSIGAYVTQHFPGFSMEDIRTMARATDRAFRDGSRKS